jgi:hypothetical protein
MAVSGAGSVRAILPPPWFFQIAQNLVAAAWWEPAVAAVFNTFQTMIAKITQAANEVGRRLAVLLE